MGQESWADYLFELPLEDEIARIRGRDPEAAEALAPVMRAFEEWLPNIPELSDREVVVEGRALYQRMASAELMNYRRVLGLTHLWRRVTKAITPALSNATLFGKLIDDE